MAKKEARISINKLESVMRENIVVVPLSGADGVDITIRRRLPLKDMMQFVENVVSSCIDAETATYTPEIKEFVIRSEILTTLLNSVAKLIESVGGLNTVLIATAGILAAIKLDAIKVFIGTTLPNVFKKLISPITTVITALSRLPAVIKSFRSGTALAVPGVSRFDAALKALGISASATQIAIGALTVVITAAIAIYSKHQQKLQEQRDAAIDAANSAGELSDEIVDLTNKYLELSEAVKTDASAKDDLLSTQDELIKKLDLEKGRIDELVEKYGNLTDAIKAASIESLQSAERDLRGGLNAYKDQLIDDADEGFFGSDSISISRGVTGKKNRDEQKELYKGLQALEQAGLVFLLYQIFT